MPTASAISVRVTCRILLADTADPTRLLQNGDRLERARLYQQLWLNLRYEEEAATGRELVRAGSQLCRGWSWI
jgi:hypothetical protein